MIKLLIFDQNLIFVEGLRLVFKPIRDIECVGVARDSNEAVTLAKDLLPEILITEVTPPYVGDLDFVKQIKTSLPFCRVVLLSQFYEQNCINASLNAGVEGFLLKSTSPEELIDAIRMVHSGKCVFDSKVYKMMLDILNYVNGGHDYHRDILSFREIQVLGFVANGMSNKKIADKLGIRPNTVACHLRHIYKRLEVDSRTAAVACAIAMDLVSVGKHAAVDTTLLVKS